MARIAPGITARASSDSRFTASVEIGVSHLERSLSHGRADNTVGSFTHLLRAGMLTDAGVESLDLPAAHHWIDRDWLDAFVVRLRCGAIGFNDDGIHLSKQVQDEMLRLFVAGGTLDSYKRHQSAQTGTCRCHRSFTAPDGTEHWLPTKDPEPGPEIQVLAFCGDDPAVLRMVRVPGGWHGEGIAAPHPELSGPEPWAVVGQCWSGQEHPVVAVSTYRPRRRTDADAVTPKKVRPNTTVKMPFVASSSLFPSGNPLGAAP